MRMLELVGPRIEFRWPDFIHNPFPTELYCWLWFSNFCKLSKSEAVIWLVIPHYRLCKPMFFTETHLAPVV